MTVGGKGRPLCGGDLCTEIKMSRRTQHWKDPEDENFRQGKKAAKTNALRSLVVCEAERRPVYLACSKPGVRGQE